ncbi:MAG: hypothetical protein H0U60_18535 [Blastocatellia bacterium]|nr:hypothetical protein [Blastocatellia bacterium]
MAGMDFSQSVILTSIFLVAILIAAFLFLRESIASGIALSKKREQEEKESQTRPPGGRR